MKSVIKCWGFILVSAMVVSLSGYLSYGQTTGTLVAWGPTSGNQYTGQTTPPAGLSNVVAIASGAYFCLALVSDGTVVAWGRNDSGQTNVPSGLSNVVEIAAGNAHALALTASGTVVAWGDNSEGETTIPSKLTNVVAISAGGNQCLALTASGSLVSWGDNSSGQENIPSGLTNVIAISAGDYFDLALTKNGNVVGWGDNTYGQINIPPGLSNVVSIAAGWNLGVGTSWGIAATSLGQVVTWGGDTQGQTNVPSGLSNVVAVATGWYHSLALKSDGTVAAWGAQGADYGQTVVPSGLSNVVAVAGGNVSSLALIGPRPPIITGPPSSSVVYGQDVTIGVSVSSQTPVSYQWYSSAPFASSPAGAYAQLTGNFVFSSVVTNGGFGYGAAPSVNFMGGGGSGAAGYATVSNRVVASITMTNAGFGYTSPPNVVFSPPNGVLFGQTNSTLTISNASQNDLGSYYVVVSNVAGSVASTMINLIILFPPSITNQPQDQVANAYGTAGFGVGVGGTSPLFYQWLLNGTNLPDANANPLTIASVTPQNLGPYSVIVTSDYGSITSSVAHLYMPPYLETPFVGVLTYLGQTNTLNIGAWGSGNLAYQWYFNGTAISGATSSNLALSDIQFTNAGLYSVVVSNPYGSVTNTPEQVVVNPANISLGIFAGVIIQGTVGYHYTIQSTTDLSNTNSWNTLTNLTLTSPVQIWNDDSADVHLGSQKLYRVLAGQ